MKRKRRTNRTKQRQAIVLEITQKLKDNLDELSINKTPLEIRDSHLELYYKSNIIERGILEKLFKETDEEL